MPNVAYTPATFTASILANSTALTSQRGAFSLIIAALFTRRSGTIVNLNSVASLVNFPMLPSYSASKAAAHSTTQALRAEFGPRDVSVLDVYPGTIDTDMAAEIDMPETTPQSAAAEIANGIEANAEEIFPDKLARTFQPAFGTGFKDLENQVNAPATA